ncbi:MAG TPA: SMP-30/gluconolactonase/LRE family protein [Vicinamibacterales bacterium]|nr:SMP-30/gluconolactonase/LRE family protein [Vicinamibacterales bacterium]
MGFSPMSMFVAPLRARRPLVAALCFSLCAGACVSLVAQQAPARGVLSDLAEATAASRRKDHAAAAAHLSRALAGAPSHPGLLSELARAEFLSGNRGAAAQRLTRALRLGGGLGVVDDPAMAPLLAGEGSAALRDAVASLRTPVSSSQEAFRIAERDLIPEGIAYDPVEKCFYVGSIYRRTIVRLDASGQATPFAGERQDDLLSVLGMKVDPGRRLLWAATEGHLNMKDAVASDVGRAALVKYDLKSRQLVKKYEVAPDPGPHLFNDVALDRGGNVFVTDSEEGSVYAVRQDADRLERLVGPGLFAYPNGIALSGDERRLFVAHLAGVSVIDVATRQVTPLPHPDDITLVGIDGLYREGRRLLAVQNGLTPPRVVEFALHEGEDRVTGMRILERGHRLFASIPTTGAVAEGWFYYIANAQLRAFTPDHRVFPREKLEETVILKTRLAP